MYAKKTTYKGLKQEKLKEFYTEYCENSIECQERNITADVSEQSKYYKFITQLK